MAQAKAHIKLIDFPILVASIILAVIGLFAVYSTTLSFDSDRYIIIQVLGAVVGLGLALILSLVDYRSIALKYKYIIVLNVLLLAFTLVFGEGIAGSTTNQNWIHIGPVTVQPSEFSKLLFIFSFASHLSLVRDKMHKFTTVLFLAIHACLIFGLILLQVLLITNSTLQKLLLG
jgi:rod shape determining protein RodA